MTGEFIRIKSSGSRGKIGIICNSKNKKGHIQIGIDGRAHGAHRLAWLYVYGEIPKNEIDHINGIRDDNRIVNLRNATHHQNCWNSAVTKSSSGLRCVFWNKKMKVWNASTSFKCKRYYLGSFATKQEAYASYIIFCKENYGEFFCDRLMDFIGVENGMV